MSKEHDKAEVEAHVLDFYRSIDISRRYEDEQLLTKAIEEGITPSTIRYGKMRDVYRGAIHDILGDAYYFTSHGENYRLVKATDSTRKWEIDQMMKNCRVGCDLVRDAEAIEKAEGSGQGGHDPAILEEEDNISAQDDLITDQHPGGAGSSTPDLPYVGRDWHADDPEGQQTVAEATQKAMNWDYNALLSGLGDTMKKAQAGAPTARPYVTASERQFMVEELGRTPDEVASGNVNLNPTQRKLYNMWTNKGLRKSISSLENWKKKNG
jgi:hypothetical protein